MLARKSISVFTYREPGKNFNKIILWDKSIVTDSTKKLFCLLFNQRCVCGSSIIVLPGGEYVFMRSDAHFDALDFSGAKIEKLRSSGQKPGSGNL